MSFRCLLTRAAAESGVTAAAAGLLVDAAAECGRARGLASGLSGVEMRTAGGRSEMLTCSGRAGRCEGSDWMEL